MQIIQDSLVSANQAIRGYKSNGTFVGAAPVAEYIDFVKLSISGGFTIQYPTDLRIVSLQADQLTSNYTVAIADLNGNTYFSNTYQALVFDPAYLLLPANHKLTVIPFANLTRLRLICQPISIIEQIPLR